MQCLIEKIITFVAVKLCAYELSSNSWTPKCGQEYTF